MCIVRSCVSKQDSKPSALEFPVPAVGVWKELHTHTHAGGCCRCCQTVLTLDTVFLETTA